ncbi:flagellar hook-associated protein FlgK [uncultured Maritalea sp.]|jgi:flagellar hook-associated protein 1 FlgK|uniref:flagellar hook-associated protein FlgK n=1 Tax=uncultured Maritalea sp. TaxID=757249 RepID=UPI002610C1E1|nr:flagellar hook-associated protein FlgK [uncultured Maritalea sp.]
MGLSVTLSNALAGMDMNQRGLTVVSRNVANAGTPGYHRQKLSLVEDLGVNSVNVRVAKVQRAYVQALETQTHRETGKMGAMDVKAGFMNQIDQLLGKPGSINSLDTQLANLKASLQSLTTSPEDFVSRSQVVDRAQSMAETLNFLSRSTQTMRVEAESQISVHVSEVNQYLSSLADINADLTDTTRDDDTRISVLDERDRLINKISELVDVSVDYRGDGSVALHTRSGIGLLDGKASQFQFQTAGNLAATALYDADPAKSGVGQLTIATPSGLAIDVVAHGVLHTGRISSLLDQRDNSLVTLQNQLDEIAAGLAQAMSTIDTAGAAVAAGGADGFEVDLANVQVGNSFTVKYVEGGTAKTVNVVRVDDASKLPMDSTAANGVRTIGLDFSGGIGAVATSLNATLGAAITVSNPAGTTIRFMDDGAGNTTDINSLNAHTTVTADQGAGTALSLFTDNGGGSFTNSLDGVPQKRGYAGRIAVNQAIVADNSLLVKHETTTSIGDATRPNYLIDQLANLEFTASTASDQATGFFKVSGNVENLVKQALNFQGNVIASTKQAYESQGVVMETLEMRAKEAYGVDIDEEMAMLLQLQNAYAANARVVSIAKELVETLMQI